MNYAITRPDYSSNRWAEIPPDHRTEIRALLEAITQAPAKGIAQWFKTKAAELGIKPGTFRAKYYAVINTRDWEVLIDERRVNAERMKARTRTQAFICHLVTTAGKYQRKSAPAFRELRRQWQRRDPIPGYEDFPGWPAVPEGWSTRNFYDILKANAKKEQLKSIRIGTSSKTNPFLPHVITTRVGLWPGGIIQLDDMRHNFPVTVGKKRDLVLVNEIGALDLYSNDRFHWGMKPRRKRADGSREDLRMQDMRSFLAGLLHGHGYSPRGTMFMSEHRTAKIEEWIAKLLYDATKGMIRVDYQPIEGKQAALSGFWHGTEGGNFRAKAALESLHNLIQNDLGALPLQTGSFSSGLKGPVVTERIITYIENIVRDVLTKLPPEKAQQRLDMLRLPAWDFHTQLLPWATDYYNLGLAMRTDHDIADWDALGHVVTDYTLLPGSDQWMSEKQFLALPEVSQLALREAARVDPKKWTNRRNLAPREVFRRKEKWLPVPPSVLCEIIGGDMAQEVTVEHGFVAFDDQEVSSETIVYKARYISGPRRGENIGHGEKVKMFIFPFDDKQNAMVVDAKDRFLGELEFYKKVLPINPAAFGSTAPYEERPDIRSEELIRAAGEKHERIAEILTPIRHQHAEAVQEARDLRAWNKKVADPKAPMTEEEHAAHRCEAGHKAAASRLRNKVESTASSISTKGVLEAWTTSETISEADGREGAGD